MGQQQTVGTHKTAVIDEIHNKKHSTAIYYHSTAVVQFTFDEIILNSGGWKTATTKARMNQASNQFGLGYSVYQKDFSWYVNFNGKTLDFSDNMVLKRS